MTLKQELYIKELPKTKYHQSKAMSNAGYSKASCRSGNLYRQLRKVTQTLDFFNPERIKVDIEDNRKQCLLAKKHAIIASIDEHRSKIAGMIVNKNENKNEDITPKDNDILRRYITLGMDRTLVPGPGIEQGTAPRPSIGQGISNDKQTLDIKQ